MIQRSLLFRAVNASDAAVQWLSVRTHNTGVMSSNPARVTIQNTIGEEGNGKPPHKIHFPRKNSEPGFCYPRHRVCDEFGT